MSDATAAPGGQWELERAQMLFTAWRLADAQLRALLEAAMRAYAQRSPTFAAQLKQLVQRGALVAHVDAADLTWLRRPGATSGVIAHALASAWALGDPSFRTELEEAIRQYVRADPAFKQVLASVQWPAPRGGMPS